MTVNEFWTRIAINAAIIFAGILFIIFTGPGGTIIVLAGIAGMVWTAVAAKMQMRKMDAAVQAKRARQSSSS